MPFKKASISKCSSLKPERLGFKMSWPKLKSSAGHFCKPTNKSVNCGLKVLVCRFANRFVTANICRFAIKKLKSMSNQQHHWDCFCNFQKSTFLRFNVSIDLGGCTSKVQHPLTKLLCCGTIISDRCCYSYSKMSWFKVKKLPTACFCKGKLRLFQVTKGCRRRL